MNANSKYPTSNECCHDDMPDYYNIIIYNKEYCWLWSAFKTRFKNIRFLFCYWSMHRSYALTYQSQYPENKIQLRAQIVKQLSTSLQSSNRSISIVPSAQVPRRQPLRGKPKEKVRVRGSGTLQIYGMVWVWVKETETRMKSFMMNHQIWSVSIMERTEGTKWWWMTLNDAVTPPADSSQRR